MIAAAADGSCHGPMSVGESTLHEAFGNSAPTFSWFQSRLQAVQREYKPRLPDIERHYHAQSLCHLDIARAWFKEANLHGQSDALQFK